MDRILARQHRVVDFFFSLTPLDPPERMVKIFSRASKSVVEVATHPVNPEEYKFLMGSDLLRLTGSIPIAPRFALPLHARG
jgi:hypothetical protein